MAINGLTDSTATELYDLMQKPGKKTLTTATKPKKQSDKYSKKRDALLEEYMNREPYEFNINTDKLYSQYSDMYKRQGQAAMKDTVAQAAEKTGGYGSSYGVTAGAQAYRGYLDKLNEIVPVLEERAYDRYNDKAQTMREDIDIYDALDTKEYDKYRDNMDDYKDEREYYRDIYEYDNDYEYNIYKALSDYALSVATLENSDYYDKADSELDLAKFNKDNYYKDLYYDLDLSKFNKENYYKDLDYKLDESKLNWDNYYKDLYYNLDLSKFNSDDYYRDIDTQIALAKLGLGI